MFSAGSTNVLQLFARLVKASGPSGLHGGVFVMIFVVEENVQSYVQDAVMSTAAEQAVHR
jgi:hypothetical protein